MEIKHELFVEDSPDLRVGDLATLKVTLKRLNYKKPENTDFAYIKSNKFPFNEKEKWYLLLVNEKNQILDVDVVIFAFFFILLGKFWNRNS